MSLRKQARDLAADAYKEALEGLFRLVESRIVWRRAHAHLLALESAQMVKLLRTAPGVLLFRKARVRTWTNRARKHGARAHAQDALLAKACGVDCG